MTTDSPKARDFAGALDDGEPKANRTPAPIVFIALFALLVFWGMVYLDDHGGGFDARVYQPYASFVEVDNRQIVDPVLEMARRGKLVFKGNCEVCHQASGLGVAGQFPPLAGSDWVAAQSPNRILRAVLNGLTGPITVSGKQFNNTMVPWKTLTDSDLAAVLTFVRQNKEWGNNAPPVTEAQVKAIRDKVATRASSFTPDELLKIPEDQ